MLKLFSSIWGRLIQWVRLGCGEEVWGRLLPLCMLIKTLKSPVLSAIPLLATSKNSVKNLRNDLPMASYLSSPVLPFLSFQAPSKKKYFFLHKEPLWHCSFGSFGKTCQKSLHSSVFYRSQRRQFYCSKAHLKAIRSVCGLKEENDRRGVSFY